MLAQRKSYLSLMAGLLVAGICAGISPSASAQSVPAAEAAAQLLLPTDATIVESRLLNPNQAEILVEVRGQISPIVMEQVRPGQWQQDLQATLTRTAEDLQTTAASQPVAQSVPAIGQTGETLLEAARGSSQLIPPIDIDEATDAALQRAGRNNPFEPLNVVVQDLEIATFNQDLPVIPDVPTIDTPILPLNFEDEPVEELPVIPQPTFTQPTPTPDPAAFAKTVELAGVIQIDNESFAIVSAPGDETTVVQTGESYQSANVDIISTPDKEVVLSEGGLQVTKSVDASVVVETGTAQ